MLRLGGVVLCIASAPVIADSVRIDCAIFIVCAAWDGLRALQHGFQPLLAVLVPEVEGSI